MSDNFNSPILISHLFEAVKFINSSTDSTIGLTKDDLQLLIDKMNSFAFDILGLREQESSDAHKEALNKAMDLVIELRAKARENKDWDTADIIRKQLTEAGIQLKDGAEGTSYTL